MVTESIKNHENLAVYQMAFKAAMTIFEISKKFPDQEKYLLTERILRSSRLICVNLAAAWHKRHDENSFVARLYDCEEAATSTQTSIKLAYKYGYLDIKTAKKINGLYEVVIGDLLKMIKNPSVWLINSDR